MVASEVILTVAQLRAAYMKDEAAVPRLARALGLRGDAPLDVIAKAANDMTGDLLTQWSSSSRFHGRIARQAARGAT